MLFPTKPANNAQKKSDNQFRILPVPHSTVFTVTRDFPDMPDLVDFVRLRETFWYGFAADIFCSILS